MKLETMKVLDVQWGTPTMPADVKKFFFKRHDWVHANDVWVEYTVGDSSEGDYEEDEEDDEFSNDITTLSILDKWLTSECELELGEEILLKHWW